MKALLQSTIMAAAAAVFLAPVAEAAYWISSTGKTHNSSCRYYQKGKGRLSANPSSTNCKICKGAAKKPLFDEESLKAARERRDSTPNLHPAAPAEKEAPAAA